MILPLRRKKLGFSIIEVVVAAVIFSIAAAGILAMSSIAGRPKAARSERAIGAALFAQQLLAWYRTKVEATSYNTGNLAEGNYTFNTGIYSAFVQIRNDTSGAGRFINIKVDWNEP
ncbi:MAG: hypothetical protein A2Z88_08710 [Omnitrophica WOR_2 bacterium GWA2_47_8]|nr:MAG: hypothetical protein A2Z88_08710 [Omnitrophica WOR_2 bacterium GWA2_47_8]